MKLVDDNNVANYVSANLVGTPVGFAKANPAKRLAGRCIATAKCSLHRFRVRERYPFGIWFGQIGGFECDGVNRQAGEQNCSD
jgi:hypothetical protein